MNGRRGADEREHVRVLKSYPFWKRTCGSIVLFHVLYYVVSETDFKMNDLLCSPMTYLKDLLDMVDCMCR